MPNAFEANSVASALGSSGRRDPVATAQAYHRRQE